MTSGFELVPTHMGHAGARRKAADRSGVKAEARYLRSFLTALEKRLHAEADTEKRHAGADALEERPAHLERIERAHHLSEVADPGKQDPGGGTKAARGVGQDVFASQFRQGILHAAQVAGAVIEDRDHNSPFVLGSWSFSRADRKSTRLNSSHV